MLPHSMNFQETETLSEFGGIDSSVYPIHRVG